MRKIAWLACLLIASIGKAMADDAKYVFYFIGDGMGVNQVQAAELYRGEMDGKIGITPLLFPTFAYSTTATTFSATNGVTDSAASGTALATGHKTKNQALGLLADLQTPIYSIAHYAKQAGKRVGVATSVSVDHATPAAFYAHVPHRKQYHQIGKDLYTAGYDFYAGSDFLEPQGKKGDAPADENLYTLAKKNNYTIARGYADYQQKAKKARKMILFQTEEASKAERSSLPYAIDRKAGDLTLEEITRAGIDFLMKEKADKGFFLMVEGGKIDWACHSNDGATAIKETVDFDNAIRVAYEFYKKYPKETLIVITADHETGGMVLGTGAYALNLQAFQHQKMSEHKFTQVLNKLRKDTNNQVTWEMAKQLLTENFGFWDKLPLSSQQEKRIRTVFDASFGAQKAEMTDSEYYKNEPLADIAKKIMNEIALMGWQSGGHSAGYVPVIAHGAGAELFQGRMDNTEISRRMAKAAGFEMK